MKYITLYPIVILLASSVETALHAQTLDAADRASMYESLDQAVKALADEQAAFEKADPDGYKKWQASRKFNLTYKASASNAIATKTPAAQKPVASDPAAIDAKRDSSKKYTYVFQNENDQSKCGGLVFALRRDMNDLGLGANGCPKPYDANGIKGALFSYGSNTVKNNDTWTAQALGALTYSIAVPFHKDAQTYQLQGMSIGVFGTTNTILNSAKPQFKNNTEVFNFGLVGNVAFEPPQGIGLYHNFDLSVSGVSNDVTNVVAYNQTIRYSPAWADLWLARPRNLDPLPLSLQFDPSLIAQFDQAGEHNKSNRLFFNNQYDSVRLGPQIIVRLLPNTSAPDDSDFSNSLFAFNRLSASLTYHWAYETIGDKALPLFAAEVDYTLDAAKHFALAATYQTGHDENTGIYMNQFLVGLTGKL